MAPVLGVGAVDMRAILDSLGWPRPLQLSPELPDNATDSEQEETADVQPLPAPPPGPEAMLASMLGLTGTVALGDHLDHIPAIDLTIRTEADLALHRQVMATMKKRHAQIYTRIDRRYGQAYQGLRPVPNAAAMLEVLLSLNVFRDRSTGTLALCTQKLSSRYRFLFSSTLGVVRKEMFWLREDVARALSYGSENTQHLLALDRILEGALEQAISKAHRHLEAGVGQRFYELLNDAILQLPDAPCEGVLDGWFSRRGFVTRFVHDCRRLTCTILNSDWSALRGLVDACCGPIGAGQASNNSGSPDHDPTMTKELP